MTLRPSAIAEQLGGGFRLRLVGEVFAENALAAALATLDAGVAPAAVVAGLAACPPVPGRFEVLHADPLIAIDYAHTPTRSRALRQRAAAGTAPRAGGLRRRRGQHAAQARAHGRRGCARGPGVITNDNPRREDPRAIAAALQQGLQRGGRAQIHVQLDRAAAIAEAIAPRRGPATWS
ncbi:MAG: hypothetical protein U0168_26095 [Nannocystaceae bacterium]